MGQSLVNNYIHLVFSTKHRQHFIQPLFEQALHSYLGGICNNMDCEPIQIGGYTDHVHLLCKLSKRVALMKLLEEAKSHSSKWMKTQDSSLRDFYWQDGYGAFSVSPTQVDKVIHYITNQHAHHKKIDFQNEFRALLKKNRLPCDERYVWD